MTVISIGGNDYEVYDSVANADIYFAASVNAPNWTAAITADKEKALVSATRVFEKMTWDGEKTSDAQALQHPRTGLTDRNGTEVSSVVIHQDVLNGFFETAESILGADTVETSSSTDSSTKKVKAGSVEVEFFSTSSRGGTRLPTQIHEYLSPYLASSRSFIAPTATGTDGVSQTDTCYNRSGPFA